MKIGSFLPLIIIVLAAYFLFLRPQQARQRKARELSNALAPGQRVMTTAGMFATVVAVDDDGVLLEIAPGVQARFVRQAISRVVTDPEPVDATEADYPPVEDVDADDRAVDADGGVDLHKAPPSSALH